MRIVDICAQYSPRGGGIRTYIEQKLAVAERFGHDITVVAPEEHDGVIEFGPHARIVQLRSPRLIVDRRYGYFDDEAAIHHVLDQYQPDFVEASSPWRSPLMVANWRPDIPKSVIMHDDPLSSFAYRILGPLLDRPSIDRTVEVYWRHLRKFGQMFDAVVCANSELSGRLAGGGVANTVLIPMGVKPGLFSPDRRDERLRARLLEFCGLGPDATLLIAASRLSVNKRLPMMIDATAIAGRQRPFGLVIFGDGRDRAQVVQAIGGNPHIRLMQPERDRTRFATILASADALLHGCEFETFGMITAEARASGVPVIVPDQGGAMDFAADGAGIIFRALDTNDAARAILALPEGSAGIRPQPQVRYMEDHFSELFAHYEMLRWQRRAQAA